MRWTTGTAIATAALTALIGGSTAAAAPPDVEEFPDVSFPGTCAGSTDTITNRLVVRRTVKTLPDGTVHYFLDVDGTVTNDDTGAVVGVRAARRFTDDPASDASRFAGLQVRFSAGGAGVLHLNAGRATGPLSVPMSEWTDFRGQWTWEDPVEGQDLPAAVCEVLVGH